MSYRNRINRDAQIFIESRYVKTLVARSCVFAFLKMMPYNRLVGYYLLFERRNGRRVVVDVPYCSFITQVSLQITIKITCSSSHTIIAVYVVVFVFFASVLVQKNFLNCFERCLFIEANFRKGENVLGVRRTSQKFDFFVYFISVAVQS